MIKACLNGSRSTEDHHAVPVTPAQLARAARDAVAAGAFAVHLHPRGADGLESFVPGDVVAAVRAVREACPGVPVGVTTRDGVVASAADKLALVREWPPPDAGGPDMASVNWHEDGALAVAEALAARGIGVEAGIWHAAAAQSFLDDGWSNRVVRVLVEIIAGWSPDGVDGARVVVSALDLAPSVSLLVHGEEEHTWPVLRWARAQGHDTRIGLEDTLLLDAGDPARDNAELVARALHL